MLIHPDNYLQNILTREQVDTGPFSPVRAVQAHIQPIIANWASIHLVSVAPSGSFAKGTANKSGTDIDLFISLSDSVSETLGDIYSKLFTLMTNKGYRPTRQNVSINVKVNGYSVDLVPGKRQNTFTSDHSLYRRKANSWTKTNVTKHITEVVNARRSSEIRILKLWRNQKGLDFPSFYLELTVLNALRQQGFGSLSNNVLRVFEYLRDTFPNAQVIDPANTNNIISEDLTLTERQRVRSMAIQALGAANWNDIVL